MLLFHANDYFGSAGLLIASDEVLSGGAIGNGWAECQ